MRSSLLLLTDDWVGCRGMWTCEVRKGERWIGGARLGKDRMRALRVNCNGPRRRKWQPAFQRPLKVLDVGACVITKSHMGKTDLKMIRIPGHPGVAGFYWRAREERIGGGVIIAVRIILTATSDGFKERG